MSASLNSDNQPKSVSTGSVTYVSGLVANVGVPVGIGSQAQSVQLLFPFPVSVAAIRIFGSWSTYDNVDSIIFKSDMAEETGVEVGIAAISLAV